LQHCVHYGPDLSLIHPVAPCPKEQCGSAQGSHDGWPPSPQPVVDGDRRRDTEWHRAFLITFAQHPECPSVRIEVINVQAREFTYADSGGIQQFHHGTVPHGHGTALLGRRCQVIHHPGHLLLVEDARQGLFPLGGLQPDGGINANQLFPQRPRGERSCGGCSAGQCGPGHACFALGTEPASKGTEFQISELSDTFLNSKTEKALDIGNVGTNGVRRPGAFPRQIAPESFNCALQRFW
jgi:hypothetical protein